MASVVMLSCFPWMFARVLASFTSVAKRLFPVDGHPHIPSPTQPLTPLPTSSLALRKVQAPFLISSGCRVPTSGVLFL